MPINMKYATPALVVLQDIWPHLTNLKWIHSASAGVEKLLFPELVKSSVIVTNAKVYIPRMASLCGQLHVVLIPILDSLQGFVMLKLKHTHLSSA